MEWMMCSTLARVTKTERSFFFWRKKSLSLPTTSQSRILAVQFVLEEISDILYLYVLICNRINFVPEGSH